MWPMNLHELSLLATSPGRRTKVVAPHHWLLLHHISVSQDRWIKKMMKVCYFLVMIIGKLLWIHCGCANENTFCLWSFDSITQLLDSIKIVSRGPEWRSWQLVPPVCLARSGRERPCGKRDALQLQQQHASIPKNTSGPQHAWSSSNYGSPYRGISAYFVGRVIWYL
jgi:hypothetical protein